MSIKPPAESNSELDFLEIRKNLLSYVKNNSEFKDYDFEASGLNFLVDLLAYNTQYSAYYLNQVANEMFLDTAQRRKNAVSIAKQMGYLTGSKKSSIAKIFLKLTGPELENNIGTISVPRYTVFYGSNALGTFPFVSWAPIILNRSNNFSSYVDLVQGQYLTEEIEVNNLLLEKKHKIGSLDIDIDHLDVFVRENANDTQKIQYYRVHDITLLNKDSEIYYLEQDYDGKYQIIFGDGILGRDIKNNNVIDVEYIATSGENGNNCRSFDIANRTILGTTYIISGGIDENDKTLPIQSSSQGHNEESIDDVRNNARKMFFSQNRTVTEKDCEIQLQKYFPFIDSISVWGGEKNTPPIFGSVFCCVKPKGRTLLTQDEKDFIISRLQQLNIITITPRIIDPEYTYIMLDIEVVYNSIYLNISDTQIGEMVKTDVIDYTQNNLLKFNRTFQSSSLQSRIKDLNQYFMGINIGLKMYQKVGVNFEFAEHYKINFNNEIEPVSLSTTTFSYMVNEQIYDTCSFQQVYYKEQNKAQLNIVKGSVVIVENIGLIDYKSGIIELENFKPEKIDNKNSNQMKFTVSTKKYNLNPEVKQIFTIDENDVTVSPIANNDEFKSSTLENASLFET